MSGVKGATRLGSDHALVATQDTRGVLVAEQGVAGVADKLVYVSKDATDAYVRNQIVPGAATDATVAAIASLVGNGILTKTAAGAISGRSLAVSGGALGVTNADGVSGNPTISISALISAIAALAGTGLIAQTGAGTVAERTLTAGTGLAVTNGNGVSGNPTAALDLTLAAQPIFLNGIRTAASVVASTTSTVNWSIAITLNTTLTAGTWQCLAIFDVRMQHSASGNADLRIVVNGSASATITEAYVSAAPGSSGFHETLGSAVSDGSTPITVTGEFRANTAGTVTPTGPRLMLIWQRTA